MVRTTTVRPRSAARSAREALVVVFPTPPEPQQTMIRVTGSSRRASTSSTGAVLGTAASGPTRGCVLRCALIGVPDRSFAEEGSGGAENRVRSSCQPLVLQQLRELVEA